MTKDMVDSELRFIFQGRLQLYKFRIYLPNKVMTQKKTNVEASYLYLQV